jgi:hypothetical protein
MPVGFNTATDPNYYDMGDVAEQPSIDTDTVITSMPLPSGLH